MIESAYALSGRQITTNEIKMLEGLRGTFNDPDANFPAKMNQFIKWLNDKESERLKIFKQTGRGLNTKESPTIKTADDYLKKFK